MYKSIFEKRDKNMEEEKKTLEKKEFIERVKSKHDYQQCGTSLLDFLKEIDDFNVFDEVHGCQFAHGQYGTPENTRGELFDMYMKDRYPRCKYHNIFPSPSVVFVAIKMAEKKPMTTEECAKKIMSYLR